MKSLSSESAQGSESLQPPELEYAPTDEKNISAGVFMSERTRKQKRKTVRRRSEAYFQHGARLEQVYFGWSSRGLKWQRRRRNVGAGRRGSPLGF